MIEYTPLHAIEPSTGWYDRMLDAWEAREQALDQLTSELLASDEGRVDALSEIEDGNLWNLAAASFDPSLSAEQREEYRRLVWDAMALKSRQFATELLKQQEAEAKAEWEDQTRPDWPY